MVSSAATMDADAAATTAACGLSCFSSAAAETAMDSAAASAANPDRKNFFLPKSRAGALRRLCPFAEFIFCLKPLNSCLILFFCQYKLPYKLIQNLCLR